MARDPVMILSVSLAVAWLVQAELLPGTYWQNDLCAAVEMPELADERSTPRRERCVEAVRIADDRSTEVLVTTDVIGTAVRFSPSAGRRHLYLEDERGRRYDYVATRDAAQYGGTAGEHSTLRGVFVFPKLESMPETLTLRERGGGLAISGIRFDESSRTSRDASRALLGAIESAEVLEIVDASRSLGGSQSRNAVLRREISGFSGTAELVRRDFGRVDDPITKSVMLPISVFEVIVTLLRESPLLDEPYVPTWTTFDWEPRAAITFRAGEQRIHFYTESQGKWQLPWTVELRGKTYVVRGEGPGRALDVLRSILPRFDGSGSVTARSSVLDGWYAGEPPSPQGAELLRAAEVGDVDRARGALSEPSAVHARREQSGETPLILAAMNRHRHLLPMLLDAGADVDASAPRSDTALSRASQHGFDDIVQILLEAGAGPNTARAGDGETPLALAASAGRADVVAMLLDAGADPNAIAPGSTPLHRAIRWGSREIVGLLVRAGADVNAPNRRGDRPATLAAPAGRVDILRTLLHAGADVSIDGGGIDHAARDGVIEIVELLLRSGAKEHIARDGLALLQASANGRTEVVTLLLEASPELPSDTAWGSPVFAAAANGYADVVRMLLAHGASPDGRGMLGMMTPLMATNVPEIVTLLLDHGADPNATDEEGTTVLMRHTSRYLSGGMLHGTVPTRPALAGDAEASIGLLVSAGGRVDAQDAEGLTALMWAARRGEKELVLALLDAGADVRMTSNRGDTALDMARERQYAEIEAILRARFPR